MKYSTIHEYNTEIRKYFENLQVTKSEVLDGLGVKDDLEGFTMELAMIGLETLKKAKRRG